MTRKISLRLQADIYEDLRDEAVQSRISISDVVRERILGFNKQMPSYSEKPTQMAKSPDENRESDFVTLEILYLLREFLFERNAQILKKVDEKMERKFGGQRKRIS